MGVSRNRARKAKEARRVRKLRRMRSDSDRRRRKMRERDKERDEWVTGQYGEKGHWSCGRKSRYRTKTEAERYARKQTEASGIQISVYACRFCGGWHLTSHPKKDEEGALKPSDVFERSRAAALQIRRIEIRKDELRDRIGPQGHGFGFTSKSWVDTPMRHVDEYIDATADLDREIRDLHPDIDEAYSLMAGIQAYDTDPSACTDAEYYVFEYYIKGRSMAELAKDAGVTQEVCKMFLAKVMEWADDIGIAHLKSMVEYE